MIQDDAAYISQRLTDNLEALLNAYSPGWVQHKGKAYLTKKSDKQLGSFQVNLTGGNRGKWYRFSRDFGGGPVSLLAYLMNGCTHEPTRSENAEAFKEARKFLGIDDGGVDPGIARKADQRRKYEQAKYEAAEQHKQEFMEEAAMDLWMASAPAQNTLAEVYFRNRVRGWDGFHTDQIRFHPEAYYSKTLKLPCIVCLVTGPDGNPVGVWRIYLNADGTNYRDETGKKVKKGLGPCAEKGGAIRLFQTDGCTTIGACEGVESGYGAWSLAGREFPIWPMMSTSGMKRFIPPFEVERIVGFPDGDIEFDDHRKTWREPPGRKAWLDLEARVQKEGIVTGMNPTEWNGTDPLDNWNDFYSRFGGVAA